MSEFAIGVISCVILLALVLVAAFAVELAGLYFAVKAAPDEGEGDE